jgi:hypothetical protein
VTYFDGLLLWTPHHQVIAPCHHRTHTWTVSKVNSEVTLFLVSFSVVVDIPGLFFVLKWSCFHPMITPLLIITM